MADKDKKAGDRGVVDSIAALRQMRYMTRGPGAESQKPPKLATVEQLRAKVSKVPTKISKKKKKRTKR